MLTFEVARKIAQDVYAGDNRAMAADVVIELLRAELEERYRDEKRRKDTSA